MTSIAAFPERTRNIAVVGHLHHGKTSLIDVLVNHTSPNETVSGFTMVHPIEPVRGVSIKAMPVSIVLPDLKGKSHLVNFMDTPGHVDFIDEVAAGVRIADGAILVVDVIEGVMANSARIIRMLVREDVPFTLVINKVDRLILELKLAPDDAYAKIRHAVEEVNSVLRFDLGLI